MSNVPLEQGLVEVTAQEMSNVPLEQSLIEVTDEEWHDFDEMMLEVEMDIFLQFIGTVHIYIVI
jgi:hypothetical protein